MTLRLAVLFALLGAAACRHAPAPPPVSALAAAPCGVADDALWHLALTREGVRRLEDGATWTILLESWNTYEPLHGYALVTRDDSGIRALRGLWAGKAASEPVPAERGAVLEEAIRAVGLRSALGSRGIADGTCYLVTIWTRDSAKRFITYEPSTAYEPSLIEPRLVRALEAHEDHFLGVWKGPDSVPLKDGNAVIHVGEPPPEVKTLETPFCVPPEPADALILEQQGFPRDEYQEAVAGVLLPEGGRVLEMVVIPSFQPEHAVYVETGPNRDCTATSAVAEESVWHVGYDHWLGNRRPLPKLPGARRHSKPISAATCWGLRTLWDLALGGPRPPEASTATRTDGSFCTSIPLDGTDFHFRARTADGWRAGKSPRGSAQPNVGALVALGEALARYTTSSSDEQARLDNELGREADELTARFRREADVRPP